LTFGITLKQNNFLVTCRKKEKFEVNKGESEAIIVGGILCRKWVWSFVGNMCDSENFSVGSMYDTQGNTVCSTYKQIAMLL